MNARSTKTASAAPGALSRLSITVIGSTAVGTAASGQVIRYDAPVLYGDTVRPRQMVVADLDSDARPDVIVMGTDGLHVYLNDGLGTFTFEITVPYERAADLVTAADFDSDGNTDLAWRDYADSNTQAIAVWYNAGDGRTGEVVLSSLPGIDVIDLAVADHDGDGRPDIVLACEPRTINLLANAGNRSFTFSSLYTYARGDHEITDLVAGDFDGDGDGDVAATFQYVYYNRYKNVKDTHVALLINDGSTPLRLASDTQLAWQQSDTVAFDMTLGDIDGDGDLDVCVAGGAWRSSLGNEIDFLRNDGGTGLTVASVHNASDGYPCGVRFADVNTDGRLDVVFANDSVRGMYIVRNDGDFAFTGISPFGSLIAGDAVAAADVDGGGQFDVIVCGSEGFAVLDNLTELRGPRYNHSALVRGQDATFVVANAGPGEDVWFVYSRVGVGNSLGYSVLGGMTIDLMERFELFGVATVQQNGRAVLRRTIPLNTESGPIATQAVIRRGPGGNDSVKTPFRAATIAD